MLQLEVRVSKTPELNARDIERATHALSSGDRSGAERAYRAAAQGHLRHQVSWSNLAALGIALGDAEGAFKHAQRSLELDQRNSDAWVNFGVASWHLGRRRDAAQALHQALQLSPGLEAAGINYAQMLRLIGRGTQAHDVLAVALLANPSSWRLQLAMAETARVLERHDVARSHVLIALGLMPIDGDRAVSNRSRGDRAADGTQVRETLIAVGRLLRQANLPFHLIGGTLLALHREGQPFPHDKDIDLGMPFDVDREAVYAAFATDYEPMLRRADPNAVTSRKWVIGYTHRATGIGVDLMFVQPRGDCMRFELGWPDCLASEVPAYGLETLMWEGIEWSIPSPPATYLVAVYGHDWNGTQNGAGYDRRYFDTQVSNPSRTPDSLPRAITLALLRLVDALRARDWAKADALAMQILAREYLPAVRRVRARLPQPVNAPA
ncbi:MAG: LicD family protein [Burkholderiaceae bacterium]